MRKQIIWITSALVAIISGLGAYWLLPATVPDWLEGKLYVALPPSGLNDDSDFELELATKFANSLHLKVKPVRLEYDQIADALAAHKIHMAAAGIRRDSLAPVRYSANYQTLREEVVCNNRAPRNLDELVKRSITVVAESAHDYALRAIAEYRPDLHWQVLRNVSAFEILKQVEEGKLDCSVANEEQLATARNFFPHLGDTYSLNSRSNLAWAFPADVDPELLKAANNFFAKVKSNRELGALIDRHYGHNERLEPIDADAFALRARTVLPHFKRWFEEAAELTGIEWQLLAALSYQESHWDPLATSFTNVRGMMMLTEETADRMHVSNRLDPRSSIIAGAKYLQLLRDSLPSRIDSQERTWMALAAYNQGMGHLEDARILTVEAKLNPDLWSDVRKVMPRLSNPDYSDHLKFGHARGGEAVILVETVHLYYDMLKRFPAERFPRAPASSFLGLRVPLHNLMHGSN